MLFNSLARAAALAAALLLPTAVAQTACNNSPLLCNRAYNNVTYLGAHDSPFLRDPSSFFSPFGNQYYNSTLQLSAGVRLLTAQVHTVNSSLGAQEYHLCHTSCAFLDAGKLSTWLRSIKTWMDVNPNEVVTILLVNSDNLPAATLAAEWVASGIDKISYVPASGTTQPTQIWPSLQQMITRNTRVVNFVANLSPSSNTVAPYLLDEFTFVFENPFSVTDAKSFTCAADRPSAMQGVAASSALQTGRMFLMNHFLDKELLLGIQEPDENAASTTNGQTGVGSLGVAAAQCAQTYGKAPTFMLVDFFNVGPAISTADALNGVSAAATVGRLQIGTGKQSATSSSSSSGQGKSSTSAAASDFGVSGLALVLALAATLVLGGQW